MRRTCLPALLTATCAAVLALAAPAVAADHSGGAAAPADATAEVNTGGSVGPADNPAPPPVARATPRATPTPTPTPTAAPAPEAASSAPAAVAPAPVSHATGNAVEPPAGGEQPSGTNRSQPLEPLPPTTGTSNPKAKGSSTHSGPSLAMTGGALVTTLMLGLGFLSAGLAGTAFARRRRTLSA